MKNISGSQYKKNKEEPSSEHSDENCFITVPKHSLQVAHKGYNAMQLIWAPVYFTIGHNTWHEYEIYYSSTPNIKNVEKIQENGTYLSRGIIETYETAPGAVKVISCKSDPIHKPSSASNVYYYNVLV